MKINKKILFLFYLVFVTTISLLPSGDVPEINVIPYIDKLVHFSMYALFSFLMLWAFPKRFAGIKQIIPFLLVVAYGFLMEVLQRYTNMGRTFDLLDELANCLGFLPGWLFWKWISDNGKLNSLFWYFPFGKKQLEE